VSRLTLTFRFNNLNGTRANDTFSINGDTTVRLQTSDEVVYNLNISGNSLEEVDNGDRLTVSNYNFTISVNDNTGVETIESGSGSANSSILGGVVNFSVAEPLVTMADNDYPS
jgi:hypothetical protein